jgi:hypothetical protein
MCKTPPLQRFDAATSTYISSRRALGRAIRDSGWQNPLRPLADGFDRPINWMILSASKHDHFISKLITRTHCSA